jgi:drug/metabolite transporter, DME family
MIIATGGVLTRIIGAPKGGGWIGPISGALSGVAFGALILVLEKIDRECDGKSNPFLVVVLNNAGCAILLLALCLVMNPIFPTASSPDKPPPFNLAITSIQFSIVSLMGIIQLGTPYILFQLAIRRVHPVDASLLILLEPILNPIWVALLTPERPDLPTYIGGAAILVALLIEAIKPNESRKLEANIHPSAEAVR